MANPLDPVIVWYTTARDGLRVTKRVLTKDTEGAITDKHVFHAAEKPNNLARLEAARVELGRMVVIALVAIFERVLRDHLAGLSRAMIHPGDALREAVQSEVSKDIEFWSISARIVDLFPGVSGTVRGEVRQVLEFRNWVAHGHTIAQPKPEVNVTVQDAYERLSEYLFQAGLLTA